MMNFFVCFAYPEVVYFLKYFTTNILYIISYIDGDCRDFVHIHSQSRLDAIINQESGLYIASANAGSVISSFGKQLLLCSPMVNPRPSSSLDCLVTLSNIIITIILS